MRNLVHILKIECVSSASLTGMLIIDKNKCRIPTVTFSKIDILDMVGVKITDAYENNQRTYTTTATFKTCAKTPLDLRGMAFRLTSKTGEKFMTGTGSRPYPVVKEDNPYPEKAVDPMTKTVTITWKSPYPPLLIIN